MAAVNQRLICGMDLEIYRAAKEGNVDVLSKKVENLHQILTPTKNTVLHIYVAYASNAKLVKTEGAVPGSTHIIKEILKMCRPLLSQSNENGETALHIAARHGSAGIVKALIETAKSRHDDGDLEKGRISSEEACSSSWQMLIRKPNKLNDTALHEAVRFKHLDVVKILTAEDPEFIYSVNDASETPLYLAVERGYPDLASEILRTCRYPAYEGPKGRTVLHAAVIYKDEEMTRELLESKKFKRVLTEVADDQGWTPLHFAAFFGHISSVKQLLEFDKSAAYAGDKDDNKTALHIAASKGHMDVLNELISQCPDCCEMVDHRRRNVLHYSVKNIQFPLIVHFVRQDPWLSNILLNGKDEKGNTPLHHATTGVYLAINESIMIGFKQKEQISAFLTDGRVDNMSFNKGNLNPWDLCVAEHTISERKMGAFEEKYGIRRGHRTISDKEFGGKVNGENKGGKDKEEREEERGELIKDSPLVVATLIATVTFAAGFTVPGGFESNKGPDQGLAVLTRNTAFKAFVMTNIIAMCLSSSSVLMHLQLSLSTSTNPKMTSVRMMKFYNMACFTTYAMLAMMIAFITGTYAVLGHSPRLATTACALASTLFVYVHLRNSFTNLIIELMPKHLQRFFYFDYYIYALDRFLSRKTLRP